MKLFYVKRVVFYFSRYILKKKKNRIIIRHRYFPIFFCSSLLYNNTNEHTMKWEYFFRRIIKGVLCDQRLQRYLRVSIQKKKNHFQLYIPSNVILLYNIINSVAFHLLLPEVLNTFPVHFYIKFRNFININSYRWK